MSRARHQHQGKYLGRQLLSKNNCKCFQEQSWNSIHGQQPESPGSGQLPAQGTEVGQVHACSAGPQGHRDPDRVIPMEYFHWRASATTTGFH